MTQFALCISRKQALMLSAFLVLVPGLAQAQAQDPPKSGDIAGIATEWANIYNHLGSSPSDQSRGADNKHQCWVNFGTSQKAHAIQWHKNYVALQNKHDFNPSIDAAKPLLPAYDSSLTNYMDCMKAPMTMQPKKAPPFYDPQSSK